MSAIRNHLDIMYNGDVTICFWAKPYNISTPARQNPFGKAYGGEGTMTMETNGSLSFYFGCCGGNCSPYTNMGATGMFTENNKWVHVCAIRNVSGVGGRVDWYRNGQYHQLRTYTSDSYDPVSSSLSFIIGDNYVNAFNGLIDDFRIYTVSLNSAQANKIYTEGARERGLIISTRH